MLWLPVSTLQKLPITPVRPGRAWQPWLIGETGPVLPGVHGKYHPWCRGPPSTSRLAEVHSQELRFHEGTAAKPLDDEPLMMHAISNKQASIGILEKAR